MLATLAGAMSTAELGLSLAEMIRQDKVQAICCTGANLEEDVFNLVAHDHYVRNPNWRNLRPEDEKNLELAGLNRVTDTCIPEQEAMRRLEKILDRYWQAADAAGERHLPHEFIYRIVRDGALAEVGADRGDAVARDRDVGDERLTPGAVDDGGVANKQTVGHGFSRIIVPLRWRFAEL